MLCLRFIPIRWLWQPGLNALTIVYVLPFFESEWIEYENKQLAKEAEKKRLKLEKKRALRV